MLLEWVECLLTGVSLAGYLCCVIHDVVLLEWG